MVKDNVSICTATIHQRHDSSEMVDAEMESPIPASSFRSSKEEHSSSSVDLKKKRKLQYDLGILDMPSPKHRLTVGANILEEPSIRETHNRLEQCLEESENDNSFIGAYDKSMASDVKVLDECSITLTINYGQSSTSLNNYTNEVTKRYFYSPKSRGIKKMSDSATADLEKALQYDPGYKVAEEIYPVFGLDHAILEFESEDNAETESMILYTNDVAPHSFIRSSGCWNLGQDVPLGAKKPTIDKEFEQYFSSLML
ncbi:hypothetical protein KSP40_PGU002599 [Platanthera guangdongensis]|uniref:Uncharacterized protein n=1 Tax=Platanthera guangdongensis TaxID=2320717 RepID=A0ABR2MB38_9ASPA